MDVLKVADAKPESAQLACPLCDSFDCPVRLPAAGAVGEFGRVCRLHQCAGCGLHFVHPQPSPEELEALYDAGFYSQAKRDDPISRLFGRYEQLCYWDRFRLFRNRARGVRLLDVGSGNGHFLAFMRDRGWQVCGVEWSRAGVEITRRQFQIDAFHGAVEEAAFPRASLDVITLWHVLEHVRDPLATMREIVRILKPGGVVVVAVPNVESLEAVHFKEKWALLDLPRHLYGFSPRTIRKLFETAGLQVRRTEHFSLEYSVSLALLGLLNFVGDHNFLYNLVKKRKHGGSRSRLFWNLCVNLACAPVALPLAVAVAAGAGLAGRGASITVVAQESETQASRPGD
ncbi:MAG: class I SAM-dependent methyltransferase [Acidobacteria bacterium]|nr:class I SAM-dependent methyltransferase [Acidobacteriota bacterium]